jgi:hypothetical protein
MDEALLDDGSAADKKVVLMRMKAAPAAIIHILFVRIFIPLSCKQKKISPITLLPEKDGLSRLRGD